MNRLFRKIVAVAGIGLMPLSAVAQLTLQECQRLAWENYPLLKQYELIKQSTDYTVKNINLGYLPQLSFTGQATYQSDVTTMPDALVGMMAQNGTKPLGLKKDQYRFALDLNQSLWDGGNRAAQKDAARAQGKVQSAQTDVSMYEVRDRVNDLFFGTLLIDDKIRLNADLQQLLLSNCGKLENLYKNGVAMQADVDAVKAEYLKTRQQGIELASMKQSFVRMLALFIGKAPEAITDLQRPSGEMPTTLENNRPELRMFDAQLGQNDAQRRLLHSGIRPRLSLFAQGFYGYTGLDMFEDMFSHDFTLNGMVGVRLNWNISQLYTHKTDSRKLKVARSSIETARETFLFNNRLLTAQETESVERYRKLMQEDDEIIRLRTSVRQSAEAKLQHGIIDVNNLLQEITRENQAKTDRSTHEVEMLKHIYELRHTVNQ